MATVSTVLVSARHSPAQVRRPRSSATSSVPKAPTPAASVAVKAPPYMPPITSVNSAATAHTSRRARRRSASVARACVCGACLGSCQVTMAMVAMNSSVSRMPGRMPARNSLPIDCSVRKP